MPLISGSSYRSFITLFTGLAVGSLLGSSIFSLIPQAFSLHLQNDKAYLWKALVIFLGIYLFYCSERMMRIYFERKTRKREQQQIQLKKNKSSTSLQPANNTEGGIQTNDNLDDNQPDSGDIGEVCLAKGQTLDENSGLALTQAHHGHSHDPMESFNTINQALKSKKQSSKQGPVVKQEIAPLAWMIIIGDGLHNFIDGLSIGAAFSESVFLGVNTSLAVIFEEFPHELGDFAVLISSGMTVKQALVFNFLSACTCYLGMIFGIVLGDMTQSASFIFALAAGMFLYISLVDMMGELSATLEECKHSARESSHLLLMQNIGILSGIFIIFALSLYGNG